MRDVREGPETIATCDSLLDCLSQAEKICTLRLTTFALFEPFAELVIQILEEFVRQPK